MSIKNKAENDLVGVGFDRQNRALSPVVSPIRKTLSQMRIAVLSWCLFSFRATA